MLRSINTRLFGSWRTRSVLFYRDFTHYSGGHRKVADYFSHLQQTRKYAPSIAFSGRTRWDETNPWFPEFQEKQVEFDSTAYDYLFLAGMDWEVYLADGVDPAIPVINLIQHVRHAEPSQDVYRFLAQRAVRICVSQEVSEAIAATGNVNGPVFTIANGHSMPDLPPTEKNWDFLIVGNKRPALARSVRDHLRGRYERICLLDRFVPAPELYARMAASRIAVLLPNETEGFYLPALEAMRYCDLTLVPDCVGNRGFCLPDVNCLMPSFSEENISENCDRAYRMLQSQERLVSFRRAAASTLAKHSPERERRKFLRVMDRLDQLW